MPPNTRSRLLRGERAFLVALLRFRLGKTTIEEHSQRTARLLPQKAVEFALIEPNALAVFTALYDTHPRSGYFWNFPEHFGQVAISASRRAAWAL